MAQNPPFFIHAVICCFSFAKLTNMYKCKKHGKLDSHWCEECQELYTCDCSELTETRFKDLIIDCEDGEITKTIYIEHCATCGNSFGVRCK
jgi:hypothetical protein